MGSTEISTILGISGASILPNCGAPLRLWHQFAAAQGWVTGYVQLAMLTNLEGAGLAGQLIANNEAFLLDLETGFRFDRFARTIRRKIRQSEVEGVVLVNDRPVLADALKRLYPATMRRVGAAAHFGFAPETLERWAADTSSLLIGAQVAGDIHAVYLFLAAGHHAESHILGCTEPGRELIAWLIWNGAAHLRQRGVKVLNLTGGVRPGDGIYRFKQGFGGIPKPRWAVCQIYDPARYDELCRLACVGPDERYFPAYRAGTARA
jgi:hypothetical protein